MKFFVGVTNNEWFEYLAARQPDEVNFWRPRSQFQVRALKAGELFLFKLHAPFNFIVGGGIYVKHAFFPLPFAWRAFGEKNGASDYETFERMIFGHRLPEERDLDLGCTVLVQPFFWPREQWIPTDRYWGQGIMSEKSFHLGTPEGDSLWAEVRARLTGDALPLVSSVEEPPNRFGAPRLVQPRLGQGAFRLEVADAYYRRCAITGERTLPALEAGHIRPYAKHGTHEIPNGILLRSDLHNLFDLGYLTVTFDYHVKVSGRIRAEFENGRDYYALDNQPLRVLPSLENARPAREFLEWHHGIFKG